MKCEEIKQKLIAFADGSGTDVERKDIQQHLNECDSCRADLESIKFIFRSARQIQIPQYDNSFWDTRYNMIIEKAQRKHQREFFSRRLRLGFGLLGVFLVFFASKAYLGKNKPLDYINTSGIAFYVSEDVLSEKSFPFSMDELKKMVDFLEPEEHMMILAEYLQ